MIKKTCYKCDGNGCDICMEKGLIKFYEEEQLTKKEKFYILLKRKEQLLRACTKCGGLKCGECEMTGKEDSLMSKNIRFNFLYLALEGYSKHKIRSSWKHLKNYDIIYDFVPNYDTLYIT